MTNCVGFRRRGEAKLTDPEKLMDPAAIRHRYGYAVDEVPEELFLPENKTSKYYFGFYPNWFGLKKSFYFYHGQYYY